MALEWSRRFVEILLISVLVFVSKTSETDLTSVSNSSSTVTVPANNNSSTIDNNSSPKNNSTSVNSSPTDDTSSTIISVLSPNNTLSTPDNNSTITSVSSPHNNNSTIDHFSPKNNNLTSVSSPDKNTLSTSVLSHNSSSTTNIPSTYNSTSTIKISNRIDELSKNITTNKTQNSNDTFPYVDDVEIKSLKLSYDEIFKFKRKCCPLDKIFVEFDHCHNAVCKDRPITQDAPNSFTFGSNLYEQTHNIRLLVDFGRAFQGTEPHLQRTGMAYSRTLKMRLSALKRASEINKQTHNDAVYQLRGDALQNEAPFQCDSGGTKPFDYPNVSVLADGSMFFFEDGETLQFPPDIIYCLWPMSEADLVLFRCPDKDDAASAPPLAYKIMKIVSSVFLTGFIVVYMMKPKLHTLHNRCLMRLMICLLGKCVLSIIFHTKFTKCERQWYIQYATAAGTYYFYMASFCWTTVICYDIWSGIGFRIRPTNNNGPVERMTVQKKIRKYSQYGWGLASVILSIAVFIDILAANADSWLAHALIAPEFAVDNNWMGTNNAMYLYFYGPLLTLNVINIVFFVLTLNTIIQVKNDNNNVFKRSECSRRHVQAERKWFYVFAQLYIVMGITWILDIIAFELSDPKYRDLKFLQIVAYSVDIFNICQGILIFFITICTKEATRALSKTFSATFMKARGSLTNSKKAIVTDPNTSNEECIEYNSNRASSKERMSEITAV